VAIRRPLDELELPHEAPVSATGTVLRTLLPSRYSPLQQNGDGIQSIYLTEVSPTFVEVLGGLMVGRRSS
jgi:putative restriction endonuclease